MPTVEDLSEFSPIRRWYDHVRFGTLDADAAALQATEIGPAIVPYLLEWLVIPDQLLNQASVQALKHFDQDQIETETIVKAIEAKADVIQAETSLNESSSFLSLLDTLKDRNSPVTRQLLFKLLDHPNDKLSAKAVSVLAAFNDAEMVTPLLLTMTKKETQLRKSRQRKLVWSLAIFGFYFLSLFLMDHFFHRFLTEHGFLIFLSLLLFHILSASFTVNYISQFRRSSVEALKEVNDLRALGPLAIAARKGEVKTPAINAIEALLDQITEDVPFSLPPEQMRALVQLLKGNSKSFTLKLVHALRFIGDEIAQERLITLEQSWKTPDPEVERKIKETLPVLRGRIERLSETRVLLRPADHHASKELLRAPAHESVEEHLLRPNQQERS